MAYAEIKQEEFEKVLSELGKWQQIKDTYAKENIYLLDGNIKIFSSIVNGLSREVGDDAIRILVWCPISNLPVKSSEARVYRIETWAKNLRERILKVKADIQCMKKCKTCGAFLVERVNSQTTEKFWGCLNYRNHGKIINTTKSNNTMSQTPPQISLAACIEGKENAGIPIPLTVSNPVKVVEIVHKSVESEFIPNKYQPPIWEFIAKGVGHLVVIAGAGCGKTYTIARGTKFIPVWHRILYLAFNKHIVVELEPKVAKHAEVKTFHSLGRRMVMRVFGNIDVDEGKQRKIIWSLLIGNNLVKKEDEVDVVHTANRLCALVKSNLIDVTEDTISELVDYHNIELPIELSQMTMIVKSAITMSLKQKTSMDYNDMIYWPLIFNLSLREDQKYDDLFIDELQDVNKSQIELALKCVKPNGRIIAVGDPNQAIYGWRGSDTEAIPSIIKRLNATVLYLSVTYRCPELIVKLANKIVPELEARPNAPEGIIKLIDYNEFFDIVKPGHMVLCRNNAPLVRLAIRLLTLGIKVCIKGRDIGENLVVIIKKFNATSIEMFYDKLQNWKTDELNKCEKGTNLEDIINDKFEIIGIMAEGCTDVRCIIDKIKSIFSDDNTAITLSSVHRVKGLEAEVIHIIEPSLMPSRHAKLEWQIKEEKCVMYVAITRSKSELYIVSESGNEGMFPEDDAPQMLLDETVKYEEI